MMITAINNVLFIVRRFVSQSGHSRTKFVFFFLSWDNKESILSRRKTHKPEKPLIMKGIKNNNI